MSRWTVVDWEAALDWKRFRDIVSPATIGITNVTIQFCDAPPANVVALGLVPLKDRMRVSAKLAAHEPLTEMA